MLLKHRLGILPKPHDRIESISRNPELDTTDLGRKPYVMPRLMLWPKPM